MTYTYSWHKWGSEQCWYATRYGLFGADWMAMPSSMSAAMPDLTVGVPCELTWRAETLPGAPTAENLLVKAWSETVKKKTTEYVSVSADKGETWSAKKAVTWSKTTGRASFTAVLEGFTYTFDLAYDKDGALTGWAQKSHVEKKKTVIDAVGSAFFTGD